MYQRNINADGVQIMIGKTAGFCYGVNNAVTKTIEMLDQTKNSKSQIFCLGELVHNRQVIEELENKGIKVIEDIEELPITDERKTVIIRAHGIPKSVYKELEKRNCEIVDLTCPNVLAIHKIAEEYSSNSYYIFIIGKKKHPEVIGTFGFCKSASIIENSEDIEIAISEFNKINKNKLLIIAQTTFSLAKFNELVDEIKEKIETENLKKEKLCIEVRNTICNATRLRQEETEELSKKVDYMVIVGGSNSSNTKKLYEIAKKNCAAIGVETSEEIKIEAIRQMINKEYNNKKGFTIGIMAGASTPKQSIDDVKKYLENVEILVR